MVPPISTDGRGIGTVLAERLSALGTRKTGIERTVLAPELELNIDDGVDCRSAD